MVSDWIQISLAIGAISITVFAVILGFIAILGYGGLKTMATNAAAKEVERQLASIYRRIKELERGKGNDDDDTNF